MLQLFKNNQLYTIAAVFIYMLLFYAEQWIGGALPKERYIETAGIAARWVYGWIGDHEWLMRVLFGVLLMLQALGLNGLIQEHRLAKRPTYITAVAYLLVIFLIQADEGLSPAFLANTFIILSLGNIYQSYDKSASMVQVFNIGFWLGVASLFYYSTSIFALWGLMGLWIMRSFDWREWLITGIGFWTPILWVGVYTLCTGQLGRWLGEDIMGNYGWNWQIPFGGWLLAGVISAGIITLWSVANWQSLHYKTNIREQKCINTAFVLLWFIPITLVMQNAVHIEHLGIAAVPLAVLLSLNIHTIQRNGIGELIHLIGMLTCLLVQYHVYFGL